MSTLQAAFTAAFPELYNNQNSEQLPDAAITAQHGAGVDVKSGSEQLATSLPVTSIQPDNNGNTHGDLSSPDRYSTKIKAIVKQFDATRASADELRGYLQAAHQKAQEEEEQALARADQEFTPAWRQTGLPMKPSHLRLEPGKMESAQLVNPKAIMGQYVQLKSKEQLNPPHTYEYNDTSIQPNYLNTTANLQTRHTRVLTDARKAAMQATHLRECKWPHLTDEEVAKRVQASEARRREQDLRMPAPQYELEKKVIASLHHKLTFLRNPRHPLPPSVKLLHSQFQPGHAWGTANAAAAKVSETMDGTATSPTRKPPIKSDMTSNPDQIFVVEPPEVVFESYEVGTVYTRTLKIRNVTQVIRTMRLFPPASQYFHLTMPRLPTNSSSIAPGMSAEVTVRFTPDSLADYDDEFAVDTAMSRFTVKLKARRPPPRLTLSEQLHIGEVLIGNRKVQEFTFSNQGGHGRFRIIPAALWPDSYHDAPQDMATLGAFEVWPLFYDLSPGDEVVINVAFEPTRMGIHEERLMLVCDNCQVKEVGIKGMASDVDVQLESVDGIPFPGRAAAALPALPPAITQRSPRTSPIPPFLSPTPEGAASIVSCNGAVRCKRNHSSPDLLPEVLDEALLDSPLWFGEVVPGSTFTRQVVVRNTTTLPFPFKWSWSSRPKVKSYNDSCAFKSPNNDVAAAVQSDHNGTGKGSPRKGHIDLVALGLTPEAAFKVTPNEGVLRPGELLEFSLTFSPPMLQRYLCWAQLLVDKTHTEAGPTVCDTTVLELGMEGMAAPLEYELAPRRIALSGTLTPGEKVRRTVTLTNKTRAPASFNFEGSCECLSITPRQGVVPPLSASKLTLEFTAGTDLGQVTASLQCAVQHGVTTPLEVIAEVQPPSLELLTKRLDFGLVRLNGWETRTLKFCNSSSTCAASWKLEECVLPPKAVESTAVGGGSSLGATENKQGQGDLTYLQFKPSSGCIPPNQEVEVEVTCHGLSDGQHHSIVKLSSPEGALHCLEAFAAVVTPRAVVSRPKVDLGIAFLGVTNKFNFTIKNLALLPLDFSWRVDGRPDAGQDQQTSGLPADLRIRPEVGTLLPGEEAEIQVRLTPSALGPITMFGICEVEGAPLPTGFMVTCICRGPDVSYDVLAPEAYDRWTTRLRDSRARRRRDDVDNFVGMTNLPPEVLARLGTSRMAQPCPAPDTRHHVANFGAAVPLGEVRSLYVVVINRTPIPSSLTTWLDTFGAPDSQLNGSTRKGSKLSLSTPQQQDGMLALPQMQLGRGSLQKGLLPQDQETIDNATVQMSMAARTSGTRAARHAPIKLNATAEKLTPFHSDSGNKMMTARRQQQGSATALGDKGLAITMTPCSCALPAWGKAVLALTAYNDMCGDYFDILHIKVGELPEKRVPVRIGVSGTPLVVQKERVLRAGLHDRASQWAATLAWGQLPVGVPLQKTFYVFNTGSLDMHLAWTFYRYQDDHDCHRPEAKLYDLTLSLEQEEGQSEPSLDGTSPGPLSTSQQLLFMGSRTSNSLITALSRNQRQDSIDAFGLGSPRVQTPDVKGLVPGQLLRSDASISLPQALQLEELLAAAAAQDRQVVKLSLARHAEPDIQPFIVEPAETVIKGGDCARFTVDFTSHRDQGHLGYLHGVQKVLSREGPICLKVWPTGEQGEGVGAMLSGTFHAFAGQPPAPLKPLRVDLSATSVVSHLEPDGNSELCFNCCSTQGPSHSSYNHLVTLTNRQTCPLIFKMHVEGPFDLTSATPSAPQDPTIYRGTVGLSTGMLPPGQPSQPTQWEPGSLYLPPGDSIDVGLKFTPPQGGQQHTDYELQGSLVVSYANGDVQRLPLSAHMMHPALEVRHSQQLVPKAEVAPPSGISPDPNSTGWADQLASQPKSDSQALSERISVLGSAAQEAATGQPAVERPTSAESIGGLMMRDVTVPLRFGLVHVQRPKPIEITLVNPTLVDAQWAVTSGDVPPKFCEQEDLPHALYSESQIGPFIIKPAQGCLGGRGIKLPRTQKITITFAPTDNASHKHELVFAVSNGREAKLVVMGQGSFDETEEYQQHLFQR